MASDAADQPLPKRALRTVTPPYGGRSDTEMNLVGYLLLAGLLVLLVPLGPFILFAWLLAKARGAYREPT